MTEKTEILHWPIRPNTSTDHSKRKTLSIHHHKHPLHPYPIPIPIPRAGAAETTPVELPQLDGDGGAPAGRPVHRCRRPMRRLLQRLRRLRSAPVPSTSASSAGVGTSLTSLPSALSSGYEKNSVRLRPNLSVMRFL